MALFLKKEEHVRWGRDWDVVKIEMPYVGYSAGESERLCWKDIVAFHELSVAVFHHCKERKNGVQRSTSGFRKNEPD